MKIVYKKIKEIAPKQLQDLFLSVDWASGKHPEKLANAIRNYGAVITAWDGDRLIGLISAMDDKTMTAYIHYLLVNPAYQKLGIGKELVRLINEHYKDFLAVVLIAYDTQVGFYEHCGFKNDGDKTPLFVRPMD